MSSAHKRVVIRRRRHEWLAGYLEMPAPAPPIPEDRAADASAPASSEALAFPPVSLAQPLTLLTPQGQLHRLPWDDFQALFLVQDFAAQAALSHLARSGVRPNGSGLWARMKFRDQSWLDALLALDLLGMAAASPFIPFVPVGAEELAPQAWAPRAAISELIALEVLGRAPRLPHPRRARAQHQLGLFESETP